MDEAVKGYIDAIPSEHRVLFDRLHRLILEAHPEATVALSYGIPAYRAGFSARHPEFLASKATIRLRPRDAAGLGDDELRDFVRATLNPGN